MALICGFAAIFGAAAPAGAATESFALTSASLPGQSSVTWQGPPVTPPSTPNVFPDATNPITLTGQMDSTTGAISGASLSLPPLPQPEQQQESTTFTFSEVSPGTATGTYNSTTGAVTLNDSLQLTFVGTGIAAITCVSTPINVALSGTYDSTTEDVTLSASGFTIPDFLASSGNNCGLAAPSLNASPGGTAGAVGNAMSLALHGNFSPLLPTTTTLTTSVPSPQLAGTSVTLNATVTDPSAAGTPTGTVNFTDNGTSLGTDTLSPSGTTGTATASLTTTSLSQTANQQITAVYLGDTAYAGSTSSAVSYTIQALPTISSTFPSQFTAGDTDFPAPTPFTLTVTDSPGGATYASNLFLYLGFATDNTWDQSSIQFSYQDQAGDWCPLTLSTRNRPPTGSGLPVAAGVFFGGLGTSPCGFGSSFSLTPGTSATFNLEVSFSQGDKYPYNFYGPMSLSTALETGTCTSSSACTAVAPLMGATSVISAAASSIVPDTGVGTVQSVVTESAGLAGATIRSGYQVNLNADVAQTADEEENLLIKQSPTGTVQFFIDGTLAATETLDSQGDPSYTPTVPYYPGVLTPGTHTETLNYSGDQLFAPSSASVTFTVIAGPPVGTLYTCQITSNEGGTAYPYDGYVTVSGGSGIPTAAFSGTSVTASDITVNLDLDAAAGNTSTLFTPIDGVMTFSPGNVSVDSGSGTWVDTSPDTDTIGTFSGMSVTTTVSGNSGDVVPIGVSSISVSFGYLGAGSLSCTPVSQPAAVGSVSIIGTTLAVSPTGSAPGGAPVTLTATVAPLPPLPNAALKTVSPGTVDFYDGSTYLGTATVVATSYGSVTGTASITTSTLSVGDHQLSAVWSGYSGVPPSTSNTVDYTVGTATTTALASSANPANAANPVTFTATVSPPPGATTQPTGDVSFTSDGNPISSCQNVSLSMASPPTATCTTSFGAGESHSIVATYSGDGTYLGSASSPLTQTTLPGTNTTILSTKDPSPAGNVTFWAGVSPSSGTGATPTGTVAFTIDGKAYAPCASQPIGSGGGASCTVSFKANTTHKVFATYAGSATYSGSKSSTITQTVTGSSGSTKPKTSTATATLASGKTLASGQSLTAGNYRLTMQADGNLVEYQGSKALWSTKTAGHSGAGVVMQKDGNLVEYFQGKALWASKTTGHAGSHLALQAKDGNVVIYGPGGRALWATGT